MEADDADEDEDEDEDGGLHIQIHSPDRSLPSCPVDEGCCTGSRIPLSGR